LSEVLNNGNKVFDKGLVGVVAVGSPVAIPVSAGVEADRLISSFS
jgi:hypothetical protein